MKKTLLPFKIALSTCLLLIGIGDAISQNLRTYTESFDTRSIPTGWSNTSSTGATSGNAVWRFEPSAFPTCYDLCGVNERTGNSGNFAAVDGSSPYPIKCTLETKSFNFVNHWNVKLEFWHVSYNSTNASAGHNDFQIDFWDGAQWHSRVFFQKSSNPSNAWYKKVVDLSRFPLKGNEEVKFRFIVDKNAGTPFYNDVFIDDLAITGEEAMLGGNNAAALGRVHETRCVGMQDIDVVISNRGTNQIDSVDIAWEVNGVAQTTFKYKKTLDTLSGTGTHTDIVTLGQVNFVRGQVYDIKYWTTMPNGVADTINDNDTSEFKQGTALSGIFSVGGTGADYANLDTVQWLLNNVGVCGPTTFELADQTFKHGMKLTRVPGNNQLNTITFKSKSGDRTKAIIWDSTSTSTNNYVIICDTASYITYKDLTISNGSANSYAAVAKAAGAANNLTFDNCHFKSSYIGNSANARLFYSEAKDLTNNISFTNCMFENGSNGINVEGDNRTAQNGLLIENCEFVNINQTAIWARYISAVKINNNTFKSTSTNTNSDAIYLNSLSDYLEVQGNFIYHAEDWPRTGLYCTSTSGKATQNNLIMNNSFAIGDTVSTVTSLKRGIHLNSVGFFSVKFNTVAVGSNNANNAAFIISNSNGNNVENNVFAGMHMNGRAVDVSGLGSILNMNNNLLYSESGQLGKFNGNDQNDLSKWQNNTGFDSKSVSEDPLFRDIDTLKICSKAADNIGTAHGLIVDIEGNLRNAIKPDPGAYEYSAISGISVDDQRICNNDTATFIISASKNDVTIWNFSDTSRVFKTTQAGTYSLTALGVCGADTTNFDVTINELVKLSNDTNICGGDTLNVMASLNNGSYKWNDGSTAQNLNVYMNGQYYVNVVDSDGCFSSDTIEVTVSKMATLRGDTSVCQGATVELDPKVSSGTYTWSKNGTPFSTATKVFVSEGAEYTLNYADAKGCQSKDTFNLTIAKQPNARFTFTQNSTQNNLRFEADDTTGTNYYWSFGDGKSVNGPAWYTLNKYATNGTFNVTLVMTSKKCGDSTFTMEVPVIGIGLNEALSNSEFKVFPNPATNQLNISFEQDAVNLNIELNSVSGSTVYSEKVSDMSGIKTLNVSNLAQGMYILNIKSEEGKLVYTQKVSIK